MTTLNHTILIIFFQQKEIILPQDQSYRFHLQIQKNLSKQVSKHQIMKTPDMKIQMAALFLKRKKYSNRERMVAKAKVSKEKKKRLKWTNEETRKYCQFIQKNEMILGKKLKKQKQRIYNRMGKYITTRNSRQCKSHHQKLIKKYFNVTTIVQKLQSQVKMNQSQNQIKKGKESVVQSKNRISAKDSFSTLQIQVDSKEATVSEGYSRQNQQLTQNQYNSLELMSNVEQQVTQQNSPNQLEYQIEQKIWMPSTLIDEDIDIYLDLGNS